MSISNIIKKSGLKLIGSWSSCNMDMLLASDRIMIGTSIACPIEVATPIYDKIKDYLDVIKVGTMCSDTKITSSR